MRRMRTPKKCPPIVNKLLLIPATEMARKIRQQEITSEEVVMAYIMRCREVNPIINAVVENRFDAALEEAREADRFVRSGIKTEEALAYDTPLFGIPVTVKESVAVKGMSNNAGVKLKHPVKARDDADVVKRVRIAGGIPLLVSNTPELCMCWETFNNVTGTSWNPYDTRRTPGGSSGGEAALLGSGASLLGIASDIGGSARLPALFCGVYGHKPSPGWIGIDGHTPTCDDPAWPTFFTIGPMVRYAQDLAMFLNIMVQPGLENNRLNEEVRLNDIKVFYVENFNSNVLNRIDPEIITGIRKLVNHFENGHKLKVQKAELPDVKHAFEASVMMLLELDGVDTIFKKGSDPREWKSVTVEVLKYITGMSSHILTNVMYGVLKKFANTLPENYKKLMYEKNNAIERQFKDLLGENGVLICPTFSSAAHFPYEIFSKICDVTYMMIFNSIGLPVTQCPLGLNNEGLPIGVQIVGNVGCDHLTIAVAREIERVFGGWQEPSSCDAVV
ncbi:hypothetical protein PV328_002668 [Microctonus aethiopoides]|uniref:Amidase domain-containing protein n=1 Tax=Microctonus aethiopoides TaxID=144406 RepID=A0AA39F6W3_9HYME|nr:hypothetical protein PV328_002668 [Microctonus aethiopoides]